jgi:hypothetical protein
MQIKSAAKSRYQVSDEHDQARAPPDRGGQRSRWLGLVADPGHEAEAFFSETELKRLPAMPGFC